LINKVLKQLGFDWIDNLSLPDQDAEPDYLFFGSTAEKEAVLEKRHEYFEINFEVAIQSLDAFKCFLAPLQTRSLPPGLRRALPPGRHPRPGR
jgi:hypothetical protein